PIDVQRQEPAHLYGGRIKITVASQHHARGIPGLGHLCLGAAPVTLGTKHRAQPRPGRLACQRRGGEALPELPAGLQRPRAQDRELGHMSCHRLLHSITDTRTVANGTDTNTKIDRARRPRTSVPISPNRRGCSWWWHTDRAQLAEGGAYAAVLSCHDRRARL